MKTVCEDYHSKRGAIVQLDTASSHGISDEFSSAHSVGLSKIVHFKRVRHLSDLSAISSELVEKEILVLGDVPVPIDVIIPYTLSIRRITLRTDFAREYVVRDYFEEGGYGQHSTFFFREAFNRDWDYLAASASLTNRSMVHSSIFEILKEATISIHIEELLLLGSTD